MHQANENHPIFESLTETIEKQLFALCDPRLVNNISTDVWMKEATRIIIDALINTDYTIFSIVYDTSTNQENNQIQGHGLELTDFPRMKHISALSFKIRFREEYHVNTWVIQLPNNQKLLVSIDAEEITIGLMD